jgi:hypothetical protein
MTTETDNYVLLSLYDDNFYVGFTADAVLVTVPRGTVIWIK